MSPVGQAQPEIPIFNEEYLNQLNDLEQSLAKFEMEAAVLNQIKFEVKDFNPNTKIEDIIPVLIGRSFESTLASIVF